MEPEAGEVASERDWGVTAGNSWELVPKALGLGG